jgi:hypothetical protein
MIRIQLSRTNWLTYAPPAMEQQGHVPKLHPEAWDFLSCLEDVDATHAVLAHRNGLEGFLRCTLTHHELFAQGTWVHPQYRRHGTAILLWNRTIERLRPEVIYADLVSPGGRALFRALRAQHPEIEFQTS